MKFFKPINFIICIIIFTNSIISAQVVVENISPQNGGTIITEDLEHQSVSGKGNTIAVSTDGQRVYLGGQSGVWRSNNGGTTWTHMEQNQPTVGSVYVSGALLCPNVYDLLISSTNKDVVLAATGSDARSPSKAGIYRSEDGGANWILVHQFINQGIVYNASRLVVAPDNPNKIYAAGGNVVAKSADGGITWIDDTIPAGNLGWYPIYNINQVEVGPQIGTSRNIYAFGPASTQINGAWYSMDDGATWKKDSAKNRVMTEGPGEGGGSGSSRTLAINPSNPNIVYLTYAIATDTSYNAVIWKGDFSQINTKDSANWTQLPSIPVGAAGTTTSGTIYIYTHLDPSGQLYLLASDSRTSQISIGEPSSIKSWKRIDSPEVHFDPHAIDMTPDFIYSPSDFNPAGRIVMLSDGGAYFSTNGIKTWNHNLEQGLSTLGLVNATVLKNQNGSTSICMGEGDNAGYFSKNDGKNWKTQDYVGGDNDACFSDPLQPNRLIVFAPRDKFKGIYLYSAPEGQIPDGSSELNPPIRIDIPGIPLLPVLPLPSDPNKWHMKWNSNSYFFNLGNRPLVYTLHGENPPPDGDFFTIGSDYKNAVLFRTERLSQINSVISWANPSNFFNGDKVFQEGSYLPNLDIDVAQASGGHENTVFYVGDPDGLKHLWKLNQGVFWQQIVPGPTINGKNVPSVALRFFVDPYRPNIIYILDSNAIRRSNDGGNTWITDIQLQNALTENNNFPFIIPYDANPEEALLRDMIFDPVNPNYRFAIGPAGVFYSINGVTWDHLILTSAMPMRPNNATYDPCERVLYVATSSLGLLKLSNLPPDFATNLPGVFRTGGIITSLTVEQLAPEFGPKTAPTNTRVILTIDSKGSFIFELKAKNVTVNLLRQYFTTKKAIQFEYSKAACYSGNITRLISP